MEERCAKATSQHAACAELFITEFDEILGFHS